MSVTGGEVAQNGRSRYESFRQEAIQLFQGGDLDRAEALFGNAIEAARELNDRRLLDTARCNRSAVRIARGDQDESVAELREILMGTPFPEVSFLSSYNIARAYELGKETKKGLFYARIARDRAETLDRRDWIASSHNQVANFLVADSYFEEAREEYLTASSHLDEGDGSSEAFRVTVLVNIGYCELVLGRVSDGLATVYDCLRRARRLGDRRLEMIAHMDLAYGLMEAERYDHAWRNARRGLELAEGVGEASWIKNGLYLAGEVAF
ncbi:MAG: hypothetical protein R3234_13610, partial [Thermoanaerobaculia bacterium]|nr:hypothetical protein [Thermoanaerobaculia bacterium]